jgi:hypothetical protein
MICTTIRKRKECSMMRKDKCIINNECKTVIEKCIGCSNIGHSKTSSTAQNGYSLRESGMQVDVISQRI